MHVSSSFTFSRVVVELLFPFCLICGMKAKYAKYNYEPLGRYSLAVVDTIRGVEICFRKPIFTTYIDNYALKSLRILTFLSSKPERYLKNLSHWASKYYLSIEIQIPRQTNRQNKEETRMMIPLITPALFWRSVKNQNKLKRVQLVQFRTSKIGNRL